MAQGGRGKGEGGRGDWAEESGEWRISVTEK